MTATFFSASVRHDPTDELRVTVASDWQYPMVTVHSGGLSQSWPSPEVAYQWLIAAANAMHVEMAKGVQDPLPAVAQWAAGK